jgi:hypothetical protein
LNFGYFTDLETAEFAEDLLATFKAAGWKPQVFKIKSIHPMYGVACGGPNPQDPALQALIGALKLVDKRVVPEGSGTSVMGQTLQPQLTDQVQMWVMVGLKRPHQLRKPQSDPSRPAPLRILEPLTGIETPLHAGSAAATC